MVMNYKSLFLIFVFLGSLISLSSSSWFVVWIGLELNLMCFVVYIFSKEGPVIEAMIKYFLIQSIGSVLLILGSFGLSYYWSFSVFMFVKEVSMNVVFIALLIKLGAAPFHFWFPNVMEGLEWLSGFMLMSWQKLAPLGMMMFLKVMEYKSLIIVSGLGMVVGALGGFNQINLKKLMAFSSIGHLGWMLIAIFLKESLFSLYFLFYCLMSGLVVMIFYYKNFVYLVQVFNESSDFYLSFILVLSNILSLGGLPPFMGFFNKWLIFYEVVNSYFVLSMIMVVSSLLTLYYYFRIMYMGMLINSGVNKLSVVKLTWNLSGLMFVSLFSLFFFLFVFLA